MPLPMSNQPYTPIPVTDDEKQAFSGESESRAIAPASSWKRTIKYGILAAALGSIAYTYTVHQKLYTLTSKNTVIDTSPDLRSGMCESITARPVKAPKENIWKDLSVKEAVGVREWLYEPERGLNLTRALGATLT